MSKTITYYYKLSVINVSKKIRMIVDLYFHFCVIHRQTVKFNLVSH